MNLFNRFRKWKGETYFAVTLLPGVDGTSNLLTTGPKAIGDRLLGRRDQPNPEDEKIQATPVDACIFDPDDLFGSINKDFQMATVWVGDDLELRLLNYNPTISVEDFTIGDIIEMLRGTYTDSSERLFMERYGI